MIKSAMKTTASALVLMSAATAGWAATSKLSPSHVVSGGEYSSGGGISVAAEVRNHSGRTLVCGVWAQSRQQSVLTSLVERRVLGSGSVFLGRERVVHGLLFMNEVAPSQNYANLPAGCVLTNRAWQPTDAQKEVKIRIPRQVVNNNRGGSRYGGGGVVVTFKQTGPGAGT
ncbi:hypothetical protein [Roseovarius rhodophyticola]|uniref:Uncharacterized protein n=1 Tax=Roseovarius rhodophyticola TaxID=3080827 RepID=A0ABZ2TJH8_9RHOB|nr:hypothetical protein [Roseovarius sp. W115]